ncbi:arylamine N-acetyltransferase [Actinacidiphila glaucinigra]|uniref:arylamine N-acetyltransferase family protein n=1 Tax=Actinacidiphila glaucinigra TaxID=235986 RepID=UPI0033A0CADF
MPFEPFVELYALRLGLALDAHRRPSAAGLKALHRAHVERVPWETLEIHLGRPTTVDPHESIARILRGRGGYCFHLNGAFATLLTALGYDVTWHRGGVHTDAGSPPPGATGGHLVLTVECEGQTWVVDVGFGEALYEPVPLRTGSYRQGPFTYRLRPSQVEPGGWRFDNDERGAFVGMDFTLAPAVPADFAEHHAVMSTSPDSQFVRVAAVARRREDGFDQLRGRTLTSTDGTGRVRRELSSADEWFGVLAGTFGITLAEIDSAERTALWEKVRVDSAARRAKPSGAGPGGHGQQ